MRRDELRRLYDVEERINEKTGRRERVLRYIGSYYRIDSQAVRQKRPLLLLLLLLSLACFVASGLIPAQAQRSMLVLPFFIVSLLPLYYACMALIKLFRMRERIDEVQRTEGLLSMQHSALGLCMLDALWFATDIAYLITTPASRACRADWVFLFLSFVCLLCSLAMHLLVKNWKAEPENTQE